MILVMPPPQRDPQLESCLSDDAVEARALAMVHVITQGRRRQRRARLIVTAALASLLLLTGGALVLLTLVKEFSP